MAQTPHTQSKTIGDNNTCCDITIGSYNTIVYSSVEDENMMDWLTPLKPDERHQSLRKDRFPGVGDWLFGTGEFQKWSGGGADEAVLFCYGDPGVGKTHLSSLVIDRLCDQAREGGIAVAWLYCDYKDQQEQTVFNIMGAILKWLVGRRIPQDIRNAFEERRRPPLEDLMRMLRTAIAALPPVFICIDALDEFQPNDLSKLLELLRDIFRECPGTRIFITGRPHVGRTIQKWFAKAVAIPISPNEDDIRNYVVMRLDRDDVPEAMDDSFRAEIVKSIPEKMSNVFLLASLNIEAVLGEATIHQRRKKLKEMEQGNGLSDAYTETLTRLKAQKKNRVELGLRALMWVCYSERPLRAKELCHALGVEIGSTDLHPGNVPAIPTLLSFCLGLLTVDPSSSIVRLVHFTLQEHLTSDPTLFYSPHAKIAEVCLTYLNFGCVRDFSPTLRSAPSAMPLLEYASVYWGEHTKREITENVKILALRLLDRFAQHISAQLLLLWHEEYSFIGLKFHQGRGPVGFTGLHGVTYLGIAELVPAVLEMREWDTNAADCTGSTPLIWAAYKGHEEVARILLKLEDVNPNCVDINCGRAPLTLAVGVGHEGVVGILLERKGINPDQADTIHGRAALSWAAGDGHEGIVKMLLERNDVNFNQADTEYGRTPLCWAALGGHEGVVKMLLERSGVDPNQADTEYGWTPLSLAAKVGQEGVVRMLLERSDVNPNQPDTEYGRTPLSWAAGSGNEEVLKLLLERSDVSPDQADTEYGRTPLSWAAGSGHKAVVRILLERNDVNPDHSDTKYGRTPRLWAALRGHHEVIKVFLELNDFRSIMQNDHKQAPPPVAPPKGHGRHIDIFLEPGHFSPHAASRSGQASLPPRVEHRNAGQVDMQPSAHDPTADTPSSNSQPSPRPADSVGVEQLPELKDSVPTYPNGLPATEQSVLSQIASRWPIKLRLSLRKSHTKPHNPPR